MIIVPVTDYHSIDLVKINFHPLGIMPVQVGSAQIEEDFPVSCFDVNGQAVFGQTFRMVRSVSRLKFVPSSDYPSFIFILIFNFFFFPRTAY